MTKIDIKKLPELKTGVGIYGSAKHQEVGGTYCFVALVAFITA